MRRAALIFLPLVALAAWDVAAADGTQAASIFTDVTGWILLKQRELHRALISGLRGLDETHGLQAAWTLIVVSFLYGVFHAVGPGHGKAIIATYLGTQEHRLKRGLWLTVAASYCQGVVAIALVYGLVVIAGWLPRDTQAAVNWVERASFALIAAIGAALALRAARALFHALSHRAAAPQAHDHHGHDHHGHDHAHGHVHDEHCDHQHAATDAMIERAQNWRATLAVVLSIGLRPCTGALLVLVLAVSLDLGWAGIAAVAAMSTGTALALATLAFAVIHARRWAIERLGKRETTAHLAANAIGLVGGCAVALLGASLLLASFGPAHPLGL